jgi:mannose-6-phosphate isomerase
MAPFFSPRPWGGDRLRSRLGKSVPQDAGKIGESWELSDHPDGRSTIAGGPLAGLDFGEALRRHPRAMCGLDEPPPRYPLLVKFIDAAEDLSIQVHPDDAHAAAAGDRGKNECWFIMDCRPGAELIHGLAPDVGPDALRRAVEAGNLPSRLRRVRIQPGDFIEVPAGTVHAIPAGTLLCEIQQSSNLTYRIWDWNREPRRELHVEQALAVVVYHAADPAGALQRTAQFDPGPWTLLANEYFKVFLSIWNAGDHCDVRGSNRHGLVLSVVQGAGRLHWPQGEPCELRLGQTWFLMPGLTEWHFEAGPAGMRLLLSQSLEF